MFFKATIIILARHNVGKVLNNGASQTITMSIITELNTGASFS